MYFETASTSHLVRKEKVPVPPLSQMLGELIAEIPPAWQWHEMVAVNPYWGLRHLPVAEALPLWSRATWAETLPSMAYFRQAFAQKSLNQEFWQESLQAAVLRRELSPQTATRYATLETWLESWQPSKGLRDLTLVDQAGEKIDPSIPQQVRREISDWCLAHFDENQAGWTQPLRDQGLFRSWLKLSKFRSLSSDSRARLLRLSADGEEALEILWQELLSGVSEDPLFDPTHYLRRLFGSQPGWASALSRPVFRAQIEGGDIKQASQGLRDFLAIRLFYDLHWLNDPRLTPRRWLDYGGDGAELRWCALAAIEDQTRQKTLYSLAQQEQKHISSQVTPPAKAKAFFCIDVRSEVVRRHLESHVPGLDTGGFAGFFGLAFHLKGQRQESRAHFPVLLNSDLSVETFPKPGEQEVRVKQDSRLVLLKSLQRSIPGGFSFAEVFGFLHLPRLLTQSLLTKSANRSSKPMITQGSCMKSDHWSLESKCQLAANALDKMGLTQNFPEFVFFFGHESTSENNPAAASLDCGACGGKSGRPNGELLAQLLNQPEVRKALQTEKGIQIPQATVFIGGVHNTTLDELAITLEQALEGDKQVRFQSLWAEMNQTMAHVRQERVAKLAVLDPQVESLLESLKERSLDWSEIRPEWGLAGNSLFIAGPRSKTRGIDLSGRAFLHDYDSATDVDLSRLELILTAPVVVASWINWQYFASSIDPDKMGSGRKALHNVAAGGFCVQGNGGDLLQGLSYESVSHGQEFVHAPQRLQVVVMAPPEALDRVIQKHPLLQDLLKGQWIHLISYNEGKSSLRETSGWRNLVLLGEPV